MAESSARVREPFGPERTVRIAADDTDFAQRLYAVVIRIGKLLLRVLPRHAERTRRDLRGQKPAHADIQIGDFAALQNARFQREVEVAPRPMARDRPRFGIPCSKNDHFERLTGCDFFLRGGNVPSGKPPMMPLR